MRVAVASDHAGFALKGAIAAKLSKEGYQVQDLGTHTGELAVDYPDFAEALAKAVVVGEAEKGVLICGSGVGACVAANKVVGARACVCHDVYSAHQGVEHDDMNVLVLGGRIIGEAVAHELVEAFLKARFSNEERHLRRLNKVKTIEARQCGAKK